MILIYKMVEFAINNNARVNVQEVANSQIYLENFLLY